MDSCADVTGSYSITVSDVIRCSGSRACQETDGTISGDEIRAYGYMGAAESNKLVADNSYVRCFAEVGSFLFLFLFFLYIRKN